MEKKDKHKEEAFLQHPVLFIAVLVIGFVLMGPFEIGPVGEIEFTPVKHDIAPYKEVMGSWPRDNESRLGNGKLEFVDEVFGPESLEFDGFGRGPYTGLADGRVVDGWARVSDGRHSPLLHQTGIISSYCWKAKRQEGFSDTILRQRQLM